FSRRQPVKRMFALPFFFPLLLAMAHHRLVLRLCTWTCSPFLISATALPMSWPYFHTVSPFLMSVRATLWPIGTSILALSRNEELSAVTTAVMSVAALRASIHATPTHSFFPLP